MGKGEATRANVLSTALGMASELGLEGVTIGLLADRTNLSKSGLFGHFKSKESLQIAILDEAADRFVSYVITPSLKKPRGEPRVRELFVRWLDWAQAEFMPGGCVFLQAMVELDDRPGPVRDRLVSTQRDWLETIATVTRIAIEEKHFRSSLDPMQFAYEFAALAYGLNLQAKTFRDSNSRDRSLASLERLIRDAQIQA